MREVLFRAKSKEDSEWVYGGYFTAKDYLSGETLHFIATKECESLPHGEFDFAIEIDPDTLGQYTGKDDKNGRKIFEGDVVKFINELEEVNAPEIGVVVYEQSECCFEVQRKVKNPENVHIPESIAVVYLFDDERCTYEVIGNIHDNPELLEDPEA